MGLGAWTIPPLCIPGEAARGVYGSLAFLSNVSMAIKTLVKKRIVIVGDSNTAMDCARSSIRLGAERFSQLAAAPNIFTAGDMHTGRSTVISAVAGGRLSAGSIHYLLTAGSISRPDNLANISWLCSPNSGKNPRSLNYL